MAPLKALVEELCSLERGSASAGERAAASLVRDRFADAGADEAYVQPFRYSRRWTDAHVAHFVAGMLAPRWLSPLVGVSYALEFSGRSQWLRALLPKGDGANAVARVRPRGMRERTVVLMAHIDTAQTGLMWRLKLPGSPATLPLIGFALRSRALLGVAAAFALDVALNRPVPGANDNACAAAGLVELVRGFAREPLERTEVIAVATGCEESGMGGAGAWLRSFQGDALVVGLDQIGAGEPHGLSGEGPPLLASYDEDGGLPRFHAPGWTDPVLARFAGLRAISIVGVADGGFPNYHLPTDTPDRVDWAAVDRCLDAARRIVIDFDR